MEQSKPEHTGTELSIYKLNSKFEDTTKVALQALGASTKRLDRWFTTKLDCNSELNAGEQPTKSDSALVTVKYPPQNYEEVNVQLIDPHPNLLHFLSLTACGVQN